MIQTYSQRKLVRKQTIEIKITHGLSRRSSSPIFSHVVCVYTVNWPVIITIFTGFSLHVFFLLRLNPWLYLHESWHNSQNLVSCHFIYLSRPPSCRQKDVWHPPLRLTRGLWMFGLRAWRRGGVILDFTWLRHAWRKLFFWRTFQRSQRGAGASHAPSEVERGKKHKENDSLPF